MPDLKSHPGPKRRSARARPAFADADVANVFAAYPDDIRPKLIELRQLILETGAEIDEVGSLTETLKWGQPSYLPQAPRIGTTVRIDAVKDEPRTYALYVHCQTSLIDTFRALYPDDFSYDGNRAIIFSSRTRLPRKALKHCIALALTYHLNQKRARRA